MKKILCLALGLFSISYCTAQQSIDDYLKLDFDELDSLMMMFYQKSDYSNAIPVTTAGRQKSLKEFGSLDTTYAEYTNNLGYFEFRLGNYEAAETLYLEAKDIRLQIFGRLHRSYASSLNNLALLYKTQGALEKALDLYLESNQINKEVLGEESEHYANTLNNLGSLYKEMGDYDQALYFYNESRNIGEKVLGKEHPRVASTINNLALLYTAKGEYEQALSLFLEIKELDERTLGREHPYFITTLNNLAGAYQDMGDYDKAEQTYKESKELSNKALGKEHPYSARAANNLGLLYSEIENFEAAAILLEEAKRIYEKLHGKAHQNVATTLNNLGLVYQGQGDYEASYAAHSKARTIRKAIYGQHHHMFIASLYNLANLCYEYNKDSMAIDLIHQVLELSTRLTLPKTISHEWSAMIKEAPSLTSANLEKVLRALAVLDEILHRKKALEQRVIVADLVQQLLTKFRNNVSSDSDKLRLLSESNNWLKRSLDLLNDANIAFDLADQNKSALLYQATKSEDAYFIGNLPDSLLKQDKALFKKRSRLEAQLQEKRSKDELSTLRIDLNQTNLAIGTFYEMLKKDYPDYYQLKHQSATISAKEVQDRLKEGEMLIEYVITDTVIHLFGINKTEILWEKQRLREELLKQKIRALHDVLSNYTLLSSKEEQAYQKYTGLAYWFYQQLLKPLLDDKENISHLIIVSDGELGHLPFEAFLVEQAPQNKTSYKDLHYVLSDYSVSYNYSAALWKENRSVGVRDNNNQMLAMAADYGNKEVNESSQRLLMDRKMRSLLGPLPAARKEVETLKEQFEGSFIFDKMASERQVKTIIDDYAILHFAMHGILDAKHPALSSLALTEDGDSLENNFLQAYEISKMDLKADLVVLSACETGYGRFEQGNGIASLARSFMYAGVPSLVVSLWKVNDGSTAVIMRLFYQYLSDGLDKAAALRQAKLDYIKAANGIIGFPAFWSPFIQVGNSQVIEINKRYNWDVLWWIGGGIMLFMGLYGGRKILKKER